MTNWLDKYEKGGFLGTTNKPFNYNGAWGGTMQNGGNNPYITPLATESTAIQFYNPVEKRNVSTANPGMSDAQMAAVNKQMAANAKREKEKSAKELSLRKQASKVMEKKGNTSFTFPDGTEKKYKDFSPREHLYVEGLALDQDTRLFPNSESSVIDEFVNPLHILGSMGKGLAQAPYEAQQSNSVLPYVTGIGNPLLMGAMGFDPLGKTINVGKNIRKGSVSPTNLQTTNYRQILNEGDKQIFLDAEGNPIGNTEVLKRNTPIYKSNFSNYDFKQNVENLPIESIPYGYSNIPLTPQEEVYNSFFNDGKIRYLPKQNSFKSEIDWSKWNKEIPSNKPLMEEYLQIEKTTKQNGTWMKNSDGSEFNGTPEQFVQQNSNNFKKAFGNTKVIDNRGNPLILHHGSKYDFSEFLPSEISGNSTTGYKGNYNYFHHSPDIAAEYASNFDPITNNYKGVKSVYINSKKPLIHKNVSNPESLIENHNEYDLISNRGLGKEYDFNKLDKNSIAFDEAEIAVPYGNYVKSAKNNNGMFDMTNPNIYKGLIPLGIGTAVLNTKIPKQAMGGSIPGSPGFTYARTGPTPSNGKYAKKTLPSAQNGISKKYIPEKVENWVEPKYVPGLNSEGHYGYNGKDTINYDPNSQIENITNPWWLEHEKYHHFQTLSGRNPKERRQKELDEQVQKMINEHPDYQFLPKNKLIGGSTPNEKGQKSFLGAEDLIYENPKTLEGEARLYEEYIANGGSSIFPKAQNGQEMSFYQHGLDWKPKSISKNGSVIKDDNGYWNPDNWGHPVEINSNNITMEGVYQPLLGISDEGHTQLMTPGNNYKFKGKKVTEFPIAQNGKQVRQPIVVNNPNDPRLKAYNDSLYAFNQNSNISKRWDKDVQLFAKYAGVPQNYPIINQEFTKNTYRDIYNMGLHGNGKQLDIVKPFENTIRGIKPEKIGRKLYYKPNGELVKIGNTPDVAEYPIYKKPVQPVVYKKEESKDIPVQGDVVNIRQPFNPQFSTPEMLGNLSPINISDQPVVEQTNNGKYQITYPTYKGSQSYDKKTFNTKKEWEDWMDKNLILSSSTERNDGGEATGELKKYQKGGRVKGKSELIKLDQLTNFTNYNTPQPGGQNWLDKYK